MFQYKNDSWYVRKHVTTKGDTTITNSNLTEKKIQCETIYAETN